MFEVFGVRLSTRKDIIVQNCTFVQTGLEIIKGRAYIKAIKYVIPKKFLKFVAAVKLTKRGARLVKQRKQNGR